MKKIKALVLLMISLLFFFGCAEKVESKIKTIDDVNVEALAGYSGTYVGDNSEIGAIVKELIGGETYDQLDLTNQQLTVSYSIETEEFRDFWYGNEKLLNENLLYNMFYLTLLVPNAKGYTLQLPDHSLTISRIDMMAFLEAYLEDLPSEEDFYKKDVMERYIADHYKEWTKLIQSESFQNDFYQQFPKS
ncbi:DUF4825 domain-containing protein [Salirhabdus sp. Marseille-P4669]|uniref:DUF4825 domain-containing protein n=1 Tax=Salirhabdus sp. Marseille-P4669 TaxID=2042310 RepID=UPI000C7C69B5|nr:DUF4825 domain-containing protein [Salirhabdus sp. Marseille-P4669]